MGDHLLLFEKLVRSEFFFAVASQLGLPELAHRLSNACAVIGRPASLLRKRAPIAPHADTMPEEMVECVTTSPT
jgi:hypothetical protein